MSSFSPKTFTTILEVCFVVAKQLIDIFDKGDEEALLKLSEVLPDTLKSRLALQLGEEKARRELGGINGR